MTLTFSERYGHSIEKKIQVNEIDKKLRVRLLNFINEKIHSLELLYNKEVSISELYKHFMKEYFVVDIRLEYHLCEQLISNEILESEWHQTYSFLE